VPDQRARQAAGHEPGSAEQDPAPDAPDLDRQTDHRPHPGRDERPDQTHHHAGRVSPGDHPGEFLRPGTGLDPFQEFALSGLAEVRPDGQGRLELGPEGAGVQLVEQEERPLEPGDGSQLRERSGFLEFRVCEAEEGVEVESGRVLGQDDPSRGRPAAKLAPALAAHALGGGQR
jgi:hypothetical protein